MRRRTVLGSALAVVLVPDLLPPRTTAAAAADTAATTDLGLPDRALLAARGGSLEISSTRTALAPGVVLERRGTLDAAGAVRSSLLRLAPRSTTRPALLQRSLSSPATPADLAAAAGAVAAVNGDFYDIDRTGTPDGPVVVAGTALKADATPQTAVGIEEYPTGWAGTVAPIVLQGTATVDGRSFALAALGTRTLPPDGIAAFTPDWGPGDRAWTAPGGVELEVRAGQVTAVRAPSAVPVPPDGVVLVATGTAADSLRRTAVGASAVTGTTVRVDALLPGSTGFALGARLELVRDTAITPIDTADPTWAALRARTAIGWTATGELLLLTVDGGTARSRGATAVETAQLLLEAGASGAVMLDGGGSAQLVARPPGAARVAVVGEPSDGGPRPVANAVGLVPAAGDGVVRDVLLRSTATGNPTRLLAGTRRTVDTVGLDSSGAALTPFATSFTATGLSVDADGTRAVVRATTPGPATLTATTGSVRSTLGLTVLGPPVRLELAQAPALAGAGASLDVTVTGRDADGRSAPVEAADLRTGTDPALLRAEPLPDGRLRLTAVGTGPDGTATTPLSLTLPGAGGVGEAGADAVVGVSIGLRDSRIDDLDDTRSWSAGTTRATATLTRVPVTDLTGAQAALRLAYDFQGQPTGTTVASVLPGRPLVLPAGTREVALTVRGDATGGWLRAVLRVDGADRPVTFAARVDWTGWRRLVVPVPDGARTVRVKRIYLAQTDVGARATGRLDLALLDARVAPTAPAARSGPPDRALGPVEDPTTSVAVTCGAHVRADTPGSEVVLERALRAAIAVGARQVLLVGDVVGPVGGRGADADVDLVRRLLDLLVPRGVRWTWVPGDGEVGTTAAAGLDSTGASATHRRVDVAGTRYLLLDSAGGSLRAADWAQLPWLRDELTALSPGGSTGVRRVVVVSPRGPGTASGDLVDPDETTVLRTWTAALQAAGTPVVIASCGGTPGAARVEGVLELALPGGGGWTLLGAGVRTPGELSAQVHAPGPVVPRTTRRVRRGAAATTPTSRGE